MYFGCIRGNNDVLFIFVKDKRVLKNDECSIVLEFEFVTPTPKSSNELHRQVYLVKFVRLYNVG